MEGRISLAVDLQITAFSGAEITEHERGLHNAMVIKDGDKYLVTQRPTIDVSIDASATIGAVQGRGVYYWSFTGFTYLVAGDTVYKGNYSTVVGTITAGIRPVYIYELDNLLLIVDAENDQAWTVNSSDTLTQITDPNFPPKDTPAVSIVPGCAVLNGVGFVMGVDGLIYNTAYEDLTTWQALGYVAAERDPDRGAFIAKHHDHIIGFGAATIEAFFYDDNNASNASPLTRRQDVFYNVGIYNGGSAWVDGDRIFFVGVNSSGGVGVWLLENFALKKISSESLDSFLSSALNTDLYVVLGSGYHSAGHIFYVITFYEETSVLTPVKSLVYDDITGIWGTIETTIGGLNEYPLIGWSKRTSTTARRGQGMMYNGDVVVMTDDLVPNDSLLASDVFVADGFVDDGFITGANPEGAAFEMRIRTGQQDFGTNRNKYLAQLGVVCNSTAASQTLTIKRSKNKSDNFDSGRSLDLSKPRFLHGLGRFKRCNFELSTTSTELVRLEALEYLIGI